MSVQPAHIIADDRERASGIVDRLREFPDVDLRIEHLLVGDFVVSGQIVFDSRQLKLSAKFSDQHTQSLLTTRKDLRQGRKDLAQRSRLNPHAKPQSRRKVTNGARIRAIATNAYGAIPHNQERERH
jgi:hypothetical protein